MIRGEHPGRKEFGLESPTAASAVDGCRSPVEQGHGNTNSTQEVCRN